MDVSSLRGTSRFAQLRETLRPFFAEYAGADQMLDLRELSAVFNDLGERKTQAELSAIFKVFDVDDSGDIDLDEFAEGCAKYVVACRRGIIVAPEPAVRSARSISTPTSASSRGAVRRSFGLEDEIGGALQSPLLQQSSGTSGNVEDSGKPRSGHGEDDGNYYYYDDDDDEKDEEDDDDDDEEMPEDIAAMDPEAQQQAIFKRATGWLLSGTILVLVFSDPFVDILVAVGGKTNIPTFYISFVLAPFVTNGSELFASYTFACKKTSSSMSCSFQQLFGAAIMNNTYCLLIFFALIYFQGLFWAFSAETLSILFVEVAMFCMASKRTHRVIDGLLVLGLYPLCLLMVWLLENVAGFD